VEAKARADDRRGDNPRARRAAPDARRPARRDHLDEPALRNDGLPLSKQREPEDPGVAVYWKTDGKSLVIAADCYTKIADNLAAVAATLDAMRAIERHGGAAILERAFTGFTALPAPMTGQKPWRDVLGVQL
jgi:hypothetical protein